MEEMFCFQCQQTAHNTGCEGHTGVCGKKSDTANLQDELTGELIRLARAVAENERSRSSDELMLKGLFTTITNVNFNSDTVKKLSDEIREEAENRKPGKDAYNVQKIWEAPEDIRSLKSLILFGLRGTAAYAYHAWALGYVDAEIMNFFYKGMRILGEEKGMEELLPVVIETGKINLRCMELLDRANTESYGDPIPTEVPLTIEKGPFIVVSGHDLHDMKLLLEQTKDKGINIYTHSEMLPAHGYPKLKEYPHLKGNFGTAWQSQQFEFHNIPAPILFTTNCLMPVRQSYADRVFTTSVVSYPEMVHIGADKDFTPVIAKALECGGYPEDHPMTGINGGTTVMTGFAHNAVLENAGKIVDLVKQGKIRHFFLILGEIEGIPRILDMGQCNDAYSAIKVAIALAEAFGCEVNELPLSMILSWYEQKAVAILLTLLALGIKNIYLGPTLPAFVSPNVLNYLVQEYQITPISTVDEDLKKILG